MKNKLFDWFLFIAGLLFFWQARLIVAEDLINGAPFELGRISLYLTQVIIFIISVIWLVGWFNNGQKTNQTKNWYLTFSAYIIYLIIYTCFFTNTSLSWSLLINWLLALLFFFTFIHQASYKNKKYFICGLLLAGVLLSVWAWLQWFFQNQFASTFLGVAAHQSNDIGAAVILLNGQRLLRAYAGLPHPNILAGYLMFIILLTVVSLKKYFLNYHHQISLAVLPLFASALMLTFSRSAILSLLIGLFLIGFCYKKCNVKKNIVLILLTILTLLFVYWPLYFSRIKQNNYLENKSINERVVSYSDYYKNLRNKWLLGRGFDGYKLLLKEKNPNSNGYEIQPVHNAWLFLLAQIGLVGLFLFGLLICFSRISLIELAPLIIIGLFDHYLTSYFSGIMLMFIYLAWFTKES
jgi:O-antigen ligase